MNREIDINHTIDRSLLSGGDYFQSLLEQATGKGLLDGDDITRLQTECLTLLAYKTERFTGGESSSVKVEKAREIMDSILYTVGLWLKTYQSPEHAVDALKNESVENIYRNGRRRIGTILGVTGALHKKLITQLIDSPNVFYSATLKDGITGFFKLYSPDYSAQEIHITADYPLYNPVPELSGVEFISAYVRGAFNENLFCRQFGKDDIHRLLLGYEKNYGELLFNIYGHVLTAALGCVLAGTDPCRLDITRQGIVFIGSVFGDMTDTEISAALETAAVKLEKSFGLPEGVRRYVGQSLPLVAKNIRGAVRDGNFSGVFYLPEYDENSSGILFSRGDKMDDKEYRRIVDEIRSCRFSGDKTEIIKREIRSLADLYDLLSDAWLSEEEMMSVFSMLTLPEISALSKMCNLYTDVDEADLREGEASVRRRLYNYVMKTEPEKREMIRRAAEAMEEK